MGKGPESVNGHRESGMPWWADVLAVIVVLGLFGAVGTALVFMGLTLAPLLHAHDYFLAVVIGVIIVLIPTLLIAGGQVPGVGSARTRGRNQT